MRVGDSDVYMAVKPINRKGSYRLYIQGPNVLDETLRYYLPYVWDIEGDDRMSTEVWIGDLARTVGEIFLTLSNWDLARKNGVLP
mgnify:CR=1 FL=1